MLAVNEKQGLRFAGRVGTGFDDRMLGSLRKTLERTRTSGIPVLQPLSAENRRGVIWVEPRRVVEVAFTGWTSGGRLRHPSFLGPREDEGVKQVVREKASSTQGMPASRSARAKPAAEAVTARGKPKAAGIEDGLEGSPTVAGVRISTPQRVVLSVRRGLSAPRCAAAARSW